MDRLEDLIRHTAQARKVMQNARAVEKAATDNRVLAEELCEEATHKMRKELNDRVDALTAPMHGDRAF